MGQSSFEKGSEKIRHHIGSGKNSQSYFTNFDNF